VSIEIIDDLIDHLPSLPSLPSLPDGPTLPGEMMSWGGGWLIPVVVAVAILGLVVAGRKVSRPAFRYSRVKLFTDPELNFYRALDRAVGKEFRILGKIRIADVVNPRKNLRMDVRKKLFYPIAAKHFDFVLCRSDSMEPVVVIELVNKEINKKDKRHRDSLVYKVCRSAKLPLARVVLKEIYETEEILIEIKRAVGDIKT